MVKKETLAKLLKFKYFQDRDIKECRKLAGLFIKSDFPMNGITTYGDAFKFLDYVQSICK